jgi:MFS transporter, ACS family, D-galactonate transporter
MTAHVAPAPGRSLWNRQLAHYPDDGPRIRYLAITVLATIVLYYELYVQGAVATQIIDDFDMSFRYFIAVGIVGNAVGAIASLLAGFADRWGRANLVVGGLLLTAGLIGVALPNAGSKSTYLVLFAVVSFVEGVVLVATPALVRDFSPQVGRAQAMGFWTLGPVLGSLVVTVVSSSTLDAQPDWRFQFYVCGAAGLVVFVVAFFGLRELSPQLRDQLMVSMRDRALIEARAAGVDPDEALQGQWRQMLRFDIIGPAFAISVFLLLYYTLVGFVVVYFATVFGYSEARANGLANWYWASNAIALVVTGVLSDRFRVRKPFMVVGAVLALVGGVLFARAATQPETSYTTFAAILALSAVGGGIAYVAWMAAFTETVEKHNPAATATGLAVWGWVVRSVVTLSFIGFTFALPAANTLVTHGERVQDIVAAYPEQVEVLNTVDSRTLELLAQDPGNLDAQAVALSALTGLSQDEVAGTLQDTQQYAQQIETAQAVDPAVLGALQSNPADPDALTAAVTQISTALGVDATAATERLRAVAAVPPDVFVTLQRNGPQLSEAGARLQSVSEIPTEDLEYLAAHAADVAAAAQDNPGQWQRWWLLCVAGQVLFLPFIFVLAGRWSPRKAREDALEHERLVEAELTRLTAEPATIRGRSADV